MATRKRFHASVSFALAISLLFSSSEASKTLPFFHRRQTNTPRVCQPEVIDRALHCGCFAYRRFYRKYPEWNTLEEFCEEESDKRITRSTVLSDCRRSQFVRSGRIGLGRMNEYFKKVQAVCMTPIKTPPRESESPEPTEIGKMPPTKVPTSAVPPYDVPPSEEPSFDKPLSGAQPSEEPSFDAQPSEEPFSKEPPFVESPYKVPPAKVPPTKVPPTKVPPTKVQLTKVPTKVPQTKATPETTRAPTGKIYARSATLESETVRIPYRAIHKMLSRFCIVFAYRRGNKLTTAQLYNLCCPRGR